MREHQKEFRLRSMCRVLEVSASGYCAWLGRPESPRARKDRDLVQDIQLVHNRSRQAYGTLKVHRALRNEGIVCGKHRIARLRRLHGIETPPQQIRRRASDGPRPAARTTGASGSELLATRYYGCSVDGLYNRQRIHQTLGYRSPLAFEASAAVA